MVPAPVAAAATVIVWVWSVAPAPSSSATPQSWPVGFCRRNAAIMIASMDPAPNLERASTALPTGVGTPAATVPDARRCPIIRERNAAPDEPARDGSIST